LEGILFDEADIDGYIARTFTPVRYLGNGSFSTVLECKEKFKDHSVAIKVFTIFYIAGYKQAKCEENIPRHAGKGIVIFAANKPSKCCRFL
jgi:hypothetical protein